MDKWHLLYSKQRRETQVRDQLLLKGLSVYLPLMPSSSASATSIARPLFPRYLFVAFDSERVSPDEIRWLPGLVGFVSFGGELATVDDSMIEHVRLRLAELQRERLMPYLPGQRLRLRAGHPFAPLDVVFDKPCSDRKRVYVLMDVLGHLTRCEIDVDYLELAGASI